MSSSLIAAFNNVLLYVSWQMPHSKLIAKDVISCMHASIAHSGQVKSHVSSAFWGERIRAALQGKMVQTKTISITKEFETQKQEWDMLRTLQNNI